MLHLSMEFQTLSDPFDSRHRIPGVQCQQTLLSFSHTHTSWWQTGVSEGLISTAPFQVSDTKMSNTNQERPRHTWVTGCAPSTA